MKSFLKILKFLFYLVIFSALIFLAYHAFKYFFNLFGSLQKEVSASIIVAFGTVMVAVLSISTTKHLDRKSRIEQEIRDKKIPVYNDFIDFLFKILNINKDPSKKMNEKQIVEFVEKFTKKLIIWGSDELILEWAKFRELGNIQPQPRNEQLELLLQLESIIYAIRKDTGHKNKNLSKGKILSLFITNLQSSGNLK